MEFNHFLTSYMPKVNIGSKVHFENMLKESVLAEKCGYATVSIPEHHLINLLMMPSPLQMAVKIASITKKINQFEEIFFKDNKSDFRNSTRKTTWKSSYKPYMKRILNIYNDYENEALEKIFQKTLESYKEGSRSSTTSNCYI